jgi:hypothetical protein
MTDSLIELRRKVAEWVASPRRTRRRAMQTNELKAMLLNHGKVRGNGDGSVVLCLSLEDLEAYFATLPAPSQDRLTAAATAIEACGVSEVDARDFAYRLSLDGSRDERFSRQTYEMMHCYNRLKTPRARSALLDMAKAVLEAERVDGTKGSTQLTGGKE